MQTTDPHAANQQRAGASSQASAGPEKLPADAAHVTDGWPQGGVGKSTADVNLAVALQQIGGWIGLMDADILGPSILACWGWAVGQTTTTTPDGKIAPPIATAEVMSMGMPTGTTTRPWLARTDGGKS